MIPNAAHRDVLSVSEQALITFVNRVQGKQKLPEITEKIQSGVHGEKALKVSFSEQPATILQWTAGNAAARDFRKACGVRYRSSPVTLATGDTTLTIPLATPERGWQATYLEATFSDGYVATTQVYITPGEKYPDTAPPSTGGACQILPGRGLTFADVKQ